MTLIQKSVSAEVPGHNVPDDWQRGVLFAVARMLEMTMDTVRAEDVMIQARMKNLDLSEFDEIDKVQLRKLCQHVKSFKGL